MQPSSSDSNEAMVLTGPGRPLERMKRTVPSPGAGEVLLRVLTCGVCRTDLHILDGELTGPKLPLVPGHEIIGAVERPNWAVLMAGGEGSRLRPLTERIPKPMIHVAGRPIIESICSRSV